MDAAELRARAGRKRTSWAPHHPGPGPSCGVRNAGAVVLLAGLADDGVERLRRATNETAARDDRPWRGPLAAGRGDSGRDRRL